MGEAALARWRRTQRGGSYRTVASAALCCAPGCQGVVLDAGSAETDAGALSVTPVDVSRADLSDVPTLDGPRDDVLPAVEDLGRRPTTLRVENQSAANPQPIQFLFAL